MSTPEERLAHRYEAAAHRMQSATALDVTRELGPTPNVDDVSRAIKDVRVGMNSAHSSIAALATLLIEKGIMDDLEYRETVTVAMEREADERCEEVCKKYNLPPGTQFA